MSRDSRLHWQMDVGDAVTVLRTEPPTASMLSLRQTLRTRRQLRRPSGFRIAIAESIAQLNPEQWDRVTAGQSWFFSRGYLGMLESVLPSQIEPRYALVRD